MILIALFLLTVFLLLYRLFKVPKDICHIPAIPLIPTLKSLITRESIAESTKRHQYLHNEHGVVRAWVFGKWIISISDVQVNKMIFQNSTDFPKFSLTNRFPNSAFAKFLGFNIVFSNGEEWDLHKKFIQPFFKASIKTYLFQSTIDSLVKKIEEQKTANISKLTTHFSLDVIGKTVLGINFDAINEKSDFVEKYELIMDNVFSPTNFILPFLDNETNPLSNSVHSAVKWFRSQFHEILKQKKHSLKYDEPKDLLSYMIKESEATPEFTDELMIVQQI